jgi:hypothetical protein
MGIRSAIAGMLIIIGMRMVMRLADIVSVAVLAGVLMMPERHALNGRHRRHALEWDGKAQ